MPTSAFSLWISLLLFLGHKCFFAEVEPLQEQRGSPEIQSCFLGEMPAVVIPGTSRIPMSSCKLYSRDKTTLSFTKEAVFFFSGGKGKSDLRGANDENNNTDGDRGSNSNCTTSDLILGWPLSSVLYLYHSLSSVYKAGNCGRSGFEWLDPCGTW